MFGCQRQPLLKSAMINEPATEWIGGSQEVAGVAPETPPQHSGRQLGEASIAGPPQGLEVAPRQDARPSALFQVVAGR